MYAFESDLSTFLPYSKPKNESQKILPSHLMPTRSNTPEEISPSKLSFGSCSDRESFAEVLTPTTRHDYDECGNVSMDTNDSSSPFEIE